MADVTGGVSVFKEAKQQSDQSKIDIAGHVSNTLQAYNTYKAVTSNILDFEQEREQIKSASFVQRQLNELDLKISSQANQTAFAERGIGYSGMNKNNFLYNRFKTKFNNAQIKNKARSQFRQLEAQKQAQEQKEKQAKGGLYSAIGGGLGAAIGSVVPGVGTAIGGAVGSALGQGVASMSD